MLPASGAGAMTFSSDTTIDAGFLVALTHSSGVNTTPPTITRVLSGNILTVSWPSDHTGWTMQTNAVSVANTSAWFEYPAGTGSRNTNQVAITMNPSKTNVFLRLKYP